MYKIFTYICITILLFSVSICLDLHHSYWMVWGVGGYRGGGVQGGIYRYQTSPLNLIQFPLQVIVCLQSNK